MFTRAIFTFCFFFAIAYCAPLLNKLPSSITTSTSTRTLPNINPPNSAEIEIEYELLGGGFEGDMIFPKGFNPSTASMTKGVAAFRPHRWPNSIVPYDISSITSVQHRYLIIQAMNTLMYSVGTPIPGQTIRKACVYFRPRQQNDDNFLKFVYGGGCSGTVGYWPGSAAIVTLANPGCFYSGIIQHELIHVLGFYHEQSRPDRDSYITVNYANIQAGAKNNFDKYVWGSSALNQNTPYDYKSIMHYGANFFSANGKPTIVPKKSGVTIGQREKLSATDIAEIRDYYECGVDT